MFKIVKEKRNKPFFMRRRWWYVRLSDDESVPDYPEVNMVLTHKAPYKAEVSYRKYFNLGPYLTFFMGKDRHIEEEFWDVFGPEAREKTQREYEEAE